ncbi:MAG: SNF2 family N-terminal domain-containing protein [Benniella sp.]|nr:MAG: SNF2 family N-terminal domain-containing protein [Benniella sp.]
MTNHLPTSTSTASSSKHPGQTQVASPNPTSPRSRKRHNKSETEEEEESSVVDGKDPDSGRTPRKRRALSVTQSSSPKQGQASTKNKVSVPEPPKVPKPLTPLDKARIAKIAEWERKLQEVVDHHDSLARELYHLETYTTTLTYDPVKIKSDHSERMLRVCGVIHCIQLQTEWHLSANEHREQLVDMLQKNVVEALPGRADMAASSDLIRLGPHRGYHSQFNSFEDYLNSFVYADEEEVTPQEADKRAEVHAELLDRIDTLKEAGRFGVRPVKPFVDPEVPKLQYNWLLEHIMTSSRLIKEEGKLQMARARKVSKMIARHFEQLHGKSEREQRLEEKRIRKLAKLTANEVKKKWRYVEGIVKARHKALLQEEQEEAGKRHLNLILEHSTQILGVQQSAFNMGIPGTPGTPGTPGRMSDVPGLSDVLSDMPSTPSGTDPISRRSSVAPSAYSSDAEIDTGDTEFTVENAEADDETTLARDESGTEDDEEEISGLEAEMDIPIEELLKQYEEGDEMDVSFAEDEQPESSHQDDIDLVSTQQSDSDLEELADLLAEREMPIESLLDKYGYELESSEYSDSYYDSDSEGEGSVMSAQQRIRSTDPRYVVTLQDVTHSRKFPTRPSKVPPKSPEVETFTTGANVKTKIPFLLRHQLREYQHVGMDWLAQLYSNGLNGILADEMGLGKTMQTIALLAHLACEHEVWGPHLIVVPTSVILNWEMEFKKWCPGFKIMTYYGSPRERKEKRIGWSRDNSFHVCITSYQLVVQDQAVFRRKAWQYLILDEAHNIKNFRSQRWQTLLNFNSARRLLLTGTPLQNNLMELWSLLYFLMPNGVSQTMPVGFANQKEFQEWFSHPVDRMIEGNDQQDEDSKAAIARLHTVLRPYLLRRLKADVETQMPAKYEHIVYCRLSKRQRFLYDDFMSRAKTRETLASGNFLSIINCLMQLRKVCNHPDLFEVRPIVTSFAMPSAIASFEITEFLIRRTIFSEIDQARESLNLEFLGFVFTNAEDRLSRMDLDRYDELDASSCFQKKAAEFATPQSKTLSNANHYQDIRQYASMRRHRQLQAHKQRWEQLGYVNKNRCHAQLVYGSSLLRMCRSPVLATEGCDNILDQVADPQCYLNYTDAIARAVVPSEARFHQNEETIKRFTFVTPAVLVQDYTWRPIHINPTPSTLEGVCQRATELFHPATSCLQIQFPDKRLLQFDCGKLQKLDSLLRELKSGGHRALIFTQMTKMLDILEIFLNIHGHRYLRLDGATKVENRQLLTDRFNSDPKILAFILSTRSGGVGINLTGADTVIFYDSDWNPSMDRQCQDRCHRIGQTRDVHIYRFVSEFTIEENMLKKANQKRMLDNVVIQEGGFTTDFFQKMDWRDMLGEEDLAKIGDLGTTNMDEEQEPSVVQGAELEQALAAAEDENDVLAMQQAKHEMEGVDVNDFSEAGTSAKTSGAKVQFAGAVSIEPAATEEDGEVIEMGHVDEYMLRFMEREYGHYVGFGGLPKPDKGEGSDGLMVPSDTPEPAEQEDEDEDEGEEEEAEEAEEAVEAEEAEEEEEEEEEDEYEIEDTEESDNGADSNGSSSEADDEENEGLEEDG